MKAISILRVFLLLVLIYAEAKIVPNTTILGGDYLNVRSGSDINITCIVTNSTESPFPVYWFHNGRLISFALEYTSSNFSPFIKYNITSFIIWKISRAGKLDSGNYTCKPSKGESATTFLNILDEIPQTTAFGDTEDNHTNFDWYSNLTDLSDYTANRRRTIKVSRSFDLRILLICIAVGIIFYGCSWFWRARWRRRLENQTQQQLNENDDDTRVRIIVLRLAKPKSTPGVQEESTCQTDNIQRTNPEQSTAAPPQPGFLLGTQPPSYSQSCGFSDAALQNPVTYLPSSRPPPF